MLRRLRRRLDDERVFGLVLLSPSAVLIGLFLVVPIAVATFMAFHRIDLTKSIDWVPNGLGNFAQIPRDRLAVESIPRTFYFAAATVLATTTFSLAFSLVLNERSRGQSILRITVLLPWAIAPLAAGVTWQMLFDLTYGALNGLLFGLGLIPHYVGWLGDSTFAINAAVMGQVWLAVPFGSLVLLARLNSIPEAIYRAAKVDGAGVWQRFRYVTLPNLRIMLIVLLLIQTVVALQTFDLIYALTRGGPAQATVVFNYLVYIRAFSELRLGYASALSALLFVIVVLASLGIVAVARGRRRRAVGAA